MDETSRRAVVRFGILAALLVLYPLGIAVVRLLPGPAQQPPSRRLEMTARWVPGAVDGLGDLVIAMQLQNDAPQSITVRQVAISVFVDGSPAVTLVEDEPLLRARLGGKLEIAERGVADFGAFKTSLPRPASGSVVAAVRCSAGEAVQTMTSEAAVTVDVRSANPPPS